jgi:hypothetical protein
MSRPRPRRRPFTWLDGLILAAFAGLGVAAAVAADATFLEVLWAEASRRVPWPGMPRWLRALELPAKRVHYDSIPFLIVVSLGVGLATFRRRAGGRRRAWRGPGVAATAIISLSLAIQAARNLYGLWPRGLWQKLDDISKNDIIYYFYGSATGPLLGVWGYMLLSRTWRLRDDWRDWLGRWLGWCWLCEIGMDVLFMAAWG